MTIMNMMTGRSKADDGNRNGVSRSRTTTMTSLRLDLCHDYMIARVSSTHQNEHSIHDEYFYDGVRFTLYFSKYLIVSGVPV